MSETRFDITLIGERAAMGGYLPQYDEFALRVYEAIETGDLEEIRVADREDRLRPSHKKQARASQIARHGILFVRQSYAGYDGRLHAYADRFS